MTNASKVAYKNGNVIYWFILLFIPFGLFFYKYTGYEFYDEAALVTLLAYMLLTVKKYPKEALICGLLFVFYILYSLYLGLNIPKACFLDMLQQAKPYIAFYCTYTMAIIIKDKKYAKIRKYVIAFAIFLFVLMAQRFTTRHGQIPIIGHPTFGATCSFVLALLYLLFSKQTKKDKYIALLIMAIGLLSGRSKFYGDFILYVFLFFFLKKKLSFNLKYLVIGALVVGIVLIFTWEKFDYYFIAGMDDPNNIRALLTKNTPVIMNEYFPFGSGFATFGNVTSSDYFSPLYLSHGFEKVTAYGGLYAGNAFFLADSFLPNLAQYGYFGLIFFCAFWYKRWKEVKRINNATAYKTALFIMGILFAENLADTMYMSNRGMMLFILLGLILNPQAELNKFMHVGGNIKERTLVQEGAIEGDRENKEHTILNS